MGKVSRGKDFFPFKQGGGGLTLDDTMTIYLTATGNGSFVNKRM